MILLCSCLMEVFFSDLSMDWIQHWLRFMDLLVVFFENPWPNTMKHAWIWACWPCCSLLSTVQTTLEVVLRHCSELEMSNNEAHGDIKCNRMMPFLAWNNSTWSHFFPGESAALKKTGHSMAISDPSNGRGWGWVDQTPSLHFQWTLRIISIFDATQKSQNSNWCQIVLHV